jgi:hypothetical protein
MDNWVGFVEKKGNKATSGQIHLAKVLAGKFRMFFKQNIN